MERRGLSRGGGDRNVALWGRFIEGSPLLLCLAYMWIMKGYCRVKFYVGSLITEWKLVSTYSSVGFLYLSGNVYSIERTLKQGDRRRQKDILVTNKSTT